MQPPYFYCLCRYEQFVREDGKLCYRTPEGVIASVDLASNTQAASVVPEDRGFAFMWSKTQILGFDSVQLGEGDCRSIAVTEEIKDAFFNTIGVRPQGATLVELLVDVLMNGDPSGMTACKPMMPVGQALELQLPGHSVAWKESFIFGESRFTAAVRNVHREDLEKAANELHSLADDFDRKGRKDLGDRLREVPQKMVDFLCESYDTSDWRQFVKPSVVSKIPGRKPHETTYTDNFNRTAGNLSGSTASGGGTWAEPVGSSWTTDGTQVVGDVYAKARLDSDTSSSNMYAQAVKVSESTGNTRGGVTVRHNASADTQYFSYHRWDLNDFGLWKSVSGTETQIGTNQSFTYSLPDTIYLEANGSSISIKVNGGSTYTQTDTSISGNTRGGLYVFRASTGGNTYDDFEVSDLASTYTGTSAVTIKAMTCSGSATFTAPVYTATAAVSIKAMTCSGSATFATATFTASAAVSIKAMTAAGSATFTPPVYTASAAVSIKAMTASGSATFVAPVYTASAAVSIKAMTAAGSASFFITTFTATAAVSIKAMTAAGSASFVAPVYTASAGVAMKAMTAAGNASFSPPVYTAVAIVSIKGMTAAGNATFTPPTFTATASLNVAPIVANGSATSSDPVYSAVASVTIKAMTCAGVASFIPENLADVDAELFIAQRRTDTFFASRTDLFVAETRANVFIPEVR